MVKTLSPFHAVTRGRENDARGREIHVQRRRNEAGRRETKKPTNGEPFKYFLINHFTKHLPHHLKLTLFLFSQHS